MERKVFSLSDVSRSIQKTLSERYKSEYWIRAELNKLNYYRQSGHCFPELVEKSGNKVVAQVKSVIWKDDFGRINDQFMQVLKEPLKDGIKILLLASISFDPVYGLTLRITDIDPAFTLGDIEKEKQETIRQLKELGIFDQNKKLRLPLLPQRIAIISDITSKGYADFVKVIEANPRGYQFFQMLFPSLLAGDRAVGSIIQQLERIRRVQNHFDVVAIIRGGGDDIGLSCFNHVRLAREIALFPMPVITGIGHSTNETVSELIAYSNAITPTKLAEYLIQIFNEFADPLMNAEKRIADLSRRLLHDEKRSIQYLAKLFQSGSVNLVDQNNNEIRSQAQSLIRQADFRFKNESSALQRLERSMQKDTQRHLQQQRENGIRLFNKLSGDAGYLIQRNLQALAALERNVGNMSPENVLKRGYSITLLNGKAVRNITELKKGDEIRSVVWEGSIDSMVHTLNKKSGNE